MRENRREIIAAHVALALSRCSMIERTYAQDVADLYIERTPLHARVVEFHSSRDPYADAKANTQIVKRMLDGRVRMPVDLEEAFILALPEPYRQHVLAELGERLGLLAAARPATTAAGQRQQVGTLVQHMGDTMQRLAPMLDDGKFDAGDAVHAAGALRELEALQAHAVTLRSAIERYVLGRSPGEAAG
jgi:hypothetical protein